MWTWRWPWCGHGDSCGLSIGTAMVLPRQAVQTPPKYLLRAPELPAPLPASLLPNRSRHEHQVSDGAVEISARVWGSWCPQVLHGPQQGGSASSRSCRGRSTRATRGVGAERLGAPAGEQGLAREHRDSIRELKCQIIRNTPANPIIVRRLQLRTVMKQLLMSNCKAVINFSFSGSQTTTS